MACRRRGSKVGERSGRSARFIKREVARRKWLRASLSVGMAWGDLDGDDATEGVATGALGLGAQAGTGLISPYGELRNGMNVMTREDFGQGTMHGITLAVGNSFNLFPLFAKRVFGNRGHLGSLVVDLGLELPISDEFGPRFVVAAGWTFVSLTSRKFVPWAPPN